MLKFFFLIFLLTGPVFTPDSNNSHDISVCEEESAGSYTDYHLDEPLQEYADAKKNQEDGIDKIAQYFENLRKDKLNKLEQIQSPINENELIELLQNLFDNEASSEEINAMIEYLTNKNFRNLQKKHLKVICDYHLERVPNEDEEKDIYTFISDAARNELIRRFGRIRAFLFELKTRKEHIISNLYFFGLSLTLNVNGKIVSKDVTMANIVHIAQQLIAMESIINMKNPSKEEIEKLGKAQALTWN